MKKLLLPVAILFTILTGCLKSDPLNNVIRINNTCFDIKRNIYTVDYEMVTYNTEQPVLIMFYHQNGDTINLHEIEKGLGKHIAEIDLGNSYVDCFGKISIYNGEFSETVDAVCNYCKDYK